MMQNWNITINEPAVYGYATDTFNHALFNNSRN